MSVCTPTPRELTCCFTGHRSIAAGDRATIRARLDEVVGKLYFERGVRHFRCGGALGFDTAAAAAVLRRRATEPDARLVLLLPCPEQTALWREADRVFYERIRVRADEVVYVGKEYSRENMFRRNRALVDGSGLCIAYMNNPHGGTAYTVRYAMRSSVEVVNLGTYQIMGEF